MNVYRSLADSELVTRLNQHDMAALEEVYLRYWPGLYDYAYRMLKDGPAAEDLTQDLFIKLLSNKESLQIGHTSLQSYLYRSIRNAVINQFHKDKNRQKYIESLKEFMENGVSATDELILEKEMTQRIEAAIATFPPKMKEVFELSRKQFLSRREVAKAAKVTESTVDTHINRALKILKNVLGLFF
ncbi:RNA polymerase sigma-70 factor [Chitinophaga oryziterrae]|uniref:RNA polymerase sigma-70 factor n=1 Tax=Chitinophaga oryziterrae TaxID=1031224 RepID=A0A6N8J4T8_9BACT|nr:RNA polymerase sigma-70 factor [Chitinophaga oryziterrae]MVT40265.1 RNA polymerase sigma-70 factor [Chitinophaga oryziterrae]